VLPTWRAALDAPGAVQMGVLRRVLEARREWWNAVPDQTVFAQEPADGPLRHVALRSARGDWALVYLSQRATVAVRMDCVGAGGAQVDTAWIDPITGRRTPIGRRAGSGTCAFTAPAGWEDALLLLEAQT
jgi:hypothetical protein